MLDHVVDVSLGYTASGAITEDGSLYMWGGNEFGKLGDGTTENRFTPKKIMDGVVAVSLGGFHTGAITEDGSLYVWGANGLGQLGNGAMEDSTIPIKIFEQSGPIATEVKADGNAGAGTWIAALIKSTATKIKTVYAEVY